MTLYRKDYSPSKELFTLTTYVTFLYSLNHHKKKKQNSIPLKICTSIENIKPLKSSSNQFKKSSSNQFKSYKNYLKNVTLKLKTTDKHFLKTKEIILKRLFTQINFLLTHYKKYSNFRMHEVTNLENGKKTIQMLPYKILGNQAYSNYKIPNTLATKQVLKQVINSIIVSKNNDTTHFKTDSIFITFFVKNEEVLKNVNPILKIEKTLKKLYGECFRTSCIEYTTNSKLHIHLIVSFKEQDFLAVNRKKENGKYKNYFHSQKIHNEIRNSIIKFTTGFIDLQPIFESEAISNYMHKETTKQHEPITDLLFKIEKTNGTYNITPNEIKKIVTIYKAITYKLRTIRNNKAFSELLKKKKQELQTEVRQELIKQIDERLPTTEKVFIKTNISNIYLNSKKEIIQSVFIGEIKRNYLFSLFEKHNIETKNINPYNTIEVPQIIVNELCIKN